eukprot:TRINITY_DN4651_c0_g2_i1.p1 TRINITY_DN4651_c0_g2~~TRINITY_DN4651_c0_g2_i1.p1  ORF type:complete len:178 (-),score=54.91 TRINITY_DN4651_c0_g2_i1:201-734(-)
MAGEKVEAAANANAPKKGGKEPFMQQFELKDVYQHFCDRKTKLLPLNDVPYVLRAMGLTIYGEEENTIKQQVEKVDGLGKPVSFQTMQSWVEENGKNYVKSYDDAYAAVRTLCHENIIGDSSCVIKVPFLRHLVSEVGDKLKPETFDKILKGGDVPTAATIQGDTCTLDEFLTFLQK